ncbi:hypothetical protein C0J52_00754 [Blattella germanica]|nr:hypothetical protein C0J52_00754 [Blattella germanica]
MYPHATHLIFEGINSLDKTGNTVRRPKVLNAMYVNSRTNKSHAWKTLTDVATAMPSAANPATVPDKMQKPLEDFSRLLGLPTSYKPDRTLRNEAVADEVQKRECHADTCRNPPAHRSPEGRDDDDADGVSQ